MRVHVCAVRMTLHRADVLEAYLNGQDNIQKATVYERTGDVVLTYLGSRKDAVALLAAYRFDNEELEVLVTSHDSRKINQEYQEKMVSLVAGRVFRKVFLPAPIRAAYTVWRSIAFVWKGIRCLLHRKLEVEVLDALSITASLLRGDYSTAGSVMFLLTVGSLLEEWTRKKSLDDLARSMALNVDKVWVRTPQGEVLVPLTRVHAGDEVVVRSGNMIPLDGTVIESSGSMDELARQLADYPGFLRPHRSYLVNMEYIQNITAKSITMESLAEVPLPHGRFTAVRDQYLEYSFAGKKVVL